MFNFTKCKDCIYYSLSVDDGPCCDCIHYKGSVEQFTPKKPKTPPVKTPEEINHPTRYAGGKYECIDVMADVFGVEAVKSFCKLNAFKYLWREQNKNGVQDLKKCAWYLDKLIELSENTDENV